MKRFDRVFGADFIRGLPEVPGVYLFRNEAGEVLYVGKAKNLRRRLSNYRNAGRKKADRKMRTLVREASSIETRVQDSEAQALLLENQLIREHRPRYNVDGAFDFLYPAIGIKRDQGQLLICFTSEPENFEDLNFEWHGTYRPRRRAREAFSAIVELLGWIGHTDSSRSLRRSPQRRGDRIIEIRRLPVDILEAIGGFLDGEDQALLPLLSAQLLESLDARQAASQIQNDLKFLQEFYDQDIRRLRDARRANAYPRTFVPRDQRDRLFIQMRNSRD